MRPSAPISSSPTPAARKRSRPCGPSTPRKYFYLGISGVHPDDGPFVLQTIREQYGTTDAYLEAEYGLTPARLMRLRRMYLE